MYVEEFPGCCALEVAIGTEVVGSRDAWSKNEAERLNDLVNVDSEYEGDSATGQVLVVTDNDKEKYKRAAAFLKKKGWKLLGAVPGAHGDYQCYLWGSKSFKVPVRRGRS